VGHTGRYIVGAARLIGRFLISQPNQRTIYSSGGLIRT
jgi:hypothetical protein